MAGDDPARWAAMAVHVIPYGGLLDLAPERITTFALDAINEAIAHAAAHPGPFDRTILTPSQLSADKGTDPDKVLADLSAQ